MNRLRELDVEHVAQRRGIRRYTNTFQLGNAIKSFKMGPASSFVQTAQEPPTKGTNPLRCRPPQVPSIEQTANDVCYNESAELHRRECRAAQGIRKYCCTYPRGNNLRLLELNVWEGLQGN